MESIVSPKYHHWQVALEWASEPGTPGHVREREGRASALAGLSFWWGDQPSEVRGSLGEGSPISWGMCAPENERADLMVQVPSPPSPGGHRSAVIGAAVITPWCRSVRWALPGKLPAQGGLSYSKSELPCLTLGGPRLSGAGGCRETEPCCPGLTGSPSLHLFRPVPGGGSTLFQGAGCPQSQHPRVERGHRPGGDAAAVQGAPCPRGYPGEVGGGKAGQSEGAGLSFAAGPRYLCELCPP